MSYLFKQLEVRDGLSHNQINHIFKDSKGFMWFSTASGLNRYDGYKFKVFSHHPDDAHSLPDNWIQNVQEDNNGRLWIRTAGGYVVFNPNNEKFVEDDELLSKMGITHTIDLIFIDKEKSMWCYANSFGCYKYESSQDELLFFPQNDEQTQLNKGVITDIKESDSCYVFVFRSGLIQYMNKNNGEISRTEDYIPNEQKGIAQNFQIFVDSDNDLWVYADFPLGAWYYDTRKNEWTHFASGNRDLPFLLSSNMIQDIIQDNNGLIWLATDHGGIDILDKKNHHITNLRNQPYNSRSIAHNSINCLYADDAGIIWIGTYKKGISFYSESIYKFRIEDLGYFNKIDNFKPDVNSIIKDEEGIIWVGTNGSGLVRLNTKNGTRQIYNQHSPNGTSLSSDVVVSLCAAKDGRLWIGTYLSGMYCYDGKKFTHYRHNPNEPNSLANDNVWSIVEDSAGMLWLGTLGSGLQRFNPHNGEFVTFNNSTEQQLSSEYISSLFAGKHNQLIIGTAIGITMHDMRNGGFEILQGNRRGDQMFTNQNVNQVYEDSRGLIWIGTRDGLNIWDRKKDEITKLYKSNGLTDNVISGIIEDDQHNMWITTSNGVSNILIHTDPIKNEYNFSFVNYNEEDGLQSHEFNLRSAFKSSDGEILLGGTNGFNIFHPEDIHYNTTRPKVRFTGLRLFNEEVHVGELNEIKEVTLKYRQNVFSVEFSAMNYVLPAKTKYAYMLEGFNTDWLVTDKGNHSVTYTNLAPGRYLLRVKAANSDGFWSEESATLPIRIKPPFWLSPFAYLLYALLVIATLIFARYMIIRNEQQKFRIKQVELEAQRKHEIDQMKLHFFTNVSHDLRTPLTLIISPLENLIKHANDEYQKSQLSLIHKNAIRLLNMVNQLLDFRKSDVNEHALQLSYGDLIIFLRNICDNFNEYAENKHIKLHFLSSVEELRMVFDQDKMRKIMMNLLSNALKFTERNGVVEISVQLLSNEGSSHNEEKTSASEEWVEIKVADSGIGIRDEEKKRVFDRFWQGKTRNEDSPGSGIGLHIVREFVNLCNGTINVYDNVPKGSLFLLRFPIDRLEYITHQSKEKQREQQERQAEGIATKSNRVSATENDNQLVTTNKENKSSVLLIDDNDDFRSFMRDALREEFMVLEAANGKEAWDIILDTSPDIIVSDVMMPEMDGYQLCEMVKNDLRTSHIPLILLTAHTAEEQELKGLETGADDYITKPFNLEILMLRIHKMIELKSKRQRKFNNQIEIKPSEITITPLDEKLIKNAIKCVEKNIEDSDFSVEKLSRELGISRVHLYKKMISVTGKSPIEFIRIIRLKRAAQLLKESQLNISEIAYRVGFNNPKNFSKYFKDEFGMLPSQYQNTSSPHTERENGNET